MFSTLLAILFPTFGVICVGWIARRAGVQGKGVASGLSDYVYYIALPAFVFQSIVRSDIGESFTFQDAQLLVGTVIAHLLIFYGAVLLQKIVRRRQENLVYNLPMLITFGSTAYLGIPFASYAFGKEGTVYSSLLSVCLVTILLCASNILLKKHSNLTLQRHRIKTLLELPLLWAVLAGLMWPVLKLPPLPVFISNLFDTIGAGAGPVALLGLGTYLYDLKSQQVPWLQALCTAFLKVTLPTILTYFVLSWLGISGVRLAVGLTMAATPTAITAFILSEEYKIGEKLSAATVLFSIFFSCAALSGITYLWLGTSLFK